MHSSSGTSSSFAVNDKPYQDLLGQTRVRQAHEARVIATQVSSA